MMNQTVTFPFLSRLGESGSSLLGGPQGRMDLVDHLAHHGTVGYSSAEEVISIVEASGLEGRGGAGFPLAVKLDTARRSGGRPLLIVNLSESEPASRKDATLGRFRPHLILDGAAALALALGTDQVVIRIHQGEAGLKVSLESAFAERAGHPQDPGWRLSEGPDRYVSGEAGAVASGVTGGIALPSFRTRPLAASGPDGRPTVVSNAETVAHVGLLVRMGAAAWRSLGSTQSPGPRLITMEGAVRRRGEVLEVRGEPTLGELASHCGVHAVPEAVLIGGYSGTWIAGETAWSLPLSDAGLSEAGASFGCGLVVVVPKGQCVLAETAILASFLAQQSAGQCGPCVLGLPTVADEIGRIAHGSRRPRHVRRLLREIDDLEGRGACKHPDATVAMVRSALIAAEGDLDRHLGGLTCVSSRAVPLLASLPGLASVTS